MPLRFSALATADVARLRAGGPDANGQPPERQVSDGDGNPCRHCLAQIPAGAGKLVLAWRPFPRPQHYAEIGPIFLCADACPRHPDGPAPPAMFLGWAKLMIRGYNSADRIVYGTGQVVETTRLAAACETLLAAPSVAYVHLRSASNNCYQARVDRA